VVRAHAEGLEHAQTLVERVTAACAEVDGVDPIDEAARMALAHRGLDGHALWLTEDGFALLRGRDLDVAVAPEARGHGAGRALVGAALGDAPARVTAWSHVDHPAAARLAEAFGFEATRALWVMSREAGPVDVPAVEGITIRGYRDTDADEVVRVNAEAFAHHPEQGSMDAADLAERMAEAWFDPAGLLVADAGPPRHGLLAFHWTKQHSPELGEVYVVAVDPAAQGRGLGRAVTAAGLAHLASRGVRRIILYVESDNEAAIATYSKLGFAHTHTHVQYARA
jgi:mycothiol synthase